MSDREQSRELVHPGETDVAAPAAPPPLGLGRQIGRAAVALTGAGFALMTGMGILGGLIDLVTKGHLTSDAVFILFIYIGAGIGGVSMMRWAFRLGHAPPDGARRHLGGAPPSAVPVQQLLLAVARDHGGRVTAAEVAAAMTIEPTYALRMLDEATQAGDARMLFSPEGIAIYEFPGLLASKDDAQARQLLYRLGEDPYRDRLMLAWARAGGIGNGAARWHDLATLPQRWSAPKFPLRAADFISRGIAEGPALGHVLTLAEDAWLAADFPLEASALAAIADHTAALFTRDHRL